MYDGGNMFTTDGRLFSNGPNGPHSRVRWTLEMVSSSDRSSSSRSGSCSSSDSYSSRRSITDDVVMVVMPHL